jgi:ABC-type branched-subunit amino acid transport system ATPase component/ABC-type branched-subunit amino acid transport system permease subunit
VRGAILLGCLEGLGIAVLAFGVVLVYRAERFVNLANAQIGVLPALLMGKVVLDAGISWYVAFPAAVALGAAIGAFFRMYVISRLENASRTALMIATLGLSQVILAFVFFEWLGPNRFVLREKGYPVPIHVHWEFDGLAFTGRDVLTVVVVPTVLIGLTVWLQSSSFGRAIRAAASNPAAARLAGVDVRRTATATWAIAGALSAIGAVVTAPSRSVVEVESLSPILLFLALGAAALAGFTSLRGAVVAGLLLGVADGVGSHVGHTAGTGLAAVFVIVIVGLLVRSFLAPSDVATVRVERSEEPFRTPESVSQRWFVRSWAVRAVFTAIAVLLPFLPWLRAPHRIFILAVFAVYAVAALSLTLLTGWGGQVSLGQFAFVAIGAFTAARLAPRGWSLLATMVVAALVGAVAAIAVGLPSARSKGLSLAVTTLGFAVVGPYWLFSQSWVAPAGTTSVSPAYEFGVGHLATQRSVYFAALTVLVLVGVGLVRLRRSNAGRRIVAVRDNERSAAMFGVSPVAVRLATFAASGALAAVAGVLWLAVNRNVNAATFDPAVSLVLLSATVIGGVSYVRGAVIGAVGIFGLPLLFQGPIQHLLPDSYQAQLFLAGFGLIAAQILNPGGIASARRPWLQKGLDWIAARSVSREVPAERDGDMPVRSRPRADGVALSARDVNVRFGGVHAVESVSVDVASGEIVGVIGANGAGKTAFLDAICGLVPAEGEVAVYGRDVSALSPARRARLGVSRGFQDAQLFAALTVRDTVELALSRHYPTGVVGALVAPPWARRADRLLAAEASTIIDRFGLAAYADVPVDRLSTGVRHICEIAAQVATRPRLLILDEPTSGVAQRETEAFAALIRGVAADLGCGVIVVEHDMPVVMSLVDRLYCLERGHVIAHGSPSAVQTDPAVVASYLGTKHRRRVAKKPAVTP